MEPVGPAEGHDCVIPQKTENDGDQVEKVAVNVLQNKWEGGFAAIFPVAALAHGAGRRVLKEAAIVRFAIIITSEAESARSAEHQERGREPPGQPVMIRIDQR